jgi:exodeoxyribonuclease-3
VFRAGKWIDAMRHFVPSDEKLYTWWSYRAADWAASNRGRRLDHILVSEALGGALQRAPKRAAGSAPPIMFR